MIAPDAVAVVLLAAGRSSRFRPRDKLAEPLAGLPLGLHAARTLGKLSFAARVAVARPDAPDFGRYGFTPIVDVAQSADQSGSIRLGLRLARLAEPKAVLIALADMPFVTIAHFEALMAQFDDEHLVIGSTDGRRGSPPALFGAAHFQALERLSGDAGARELLRGAPLVAAPPSVLADIDTRADLASHRLRAG